MPGRKVLFIAIGLLCLITAVWIHVPPADRKRALRVLANLLNPGGILVMSIRDGSIEPEIV